jgi:hypothetical protein
LDIDKGTGMYRGNTFFDIIGRSNKKEKTTVGDFCGEDLAKCYGQPEQEAGYGQQNKPKKHTVPSKRRQW